MHMVTMRLMLPYSSASVTPKPYEQSGVCDESFHATSHPQILMDAVPELQRKHIAFSSVQKWREI